MHPTCPLVIPTGQLQAIAHSQARPSRCTIKRRRTPTFPLSLRVPFAACTAYTGFGRRFGRGSPRAAGCIAKGRRDRSVWRLPANTRPSGELGARIATCQGLKLPNRVTPVPLALTQLTQISHSIHSNLALAADSHTALWFHRSSRVALPVTSKLSGCCFGQSLAVQCSAVQCSPLPLVRPSSLTAWSVVPVPQICARGHISATVRPCRLDANFLSSPCEPTLSISNTATMTLIDMALPSLPRIECNF
ncbi:hypothetical protein EJ04DRAFT_222731 [Polyplosphaeria fusca]|uniref:Uncharacterized protein n=1 Tax=Polyplosphaeria fusca TaxID=682080 RepID=A0A9P4R225_9PLEO|nr:hypothetical protein EJ04DRAFT_222731 [Polyplosphaeria fusca]